MSEEFGRASCKVIPPRSPNLDLGRLLRMRDGERGRRTQANQAETWASKDNLFEMKKYLQQVGSNRLLRSETVTVSFTTPSSLLAENTVAVRSTNDVSDQSSNRWRRRELNPRPRLINQPRLHA